MRTLLVSVRQALRGTGFLLSVLGVIAVVLLSSIEGLLTAFRSDKLMESGYCIRLLQAAIHSDAMSFTLPILCALPYTASFIDDVKNGFIKAYLPRASVNSYVFGKGVACAISGGLCIAMGTLAAYGVTALVMLPMQAKGVIEHAAFSELINSILLCSCSGAMWAMAGLTFAAFTFSKYMAYASPFVIYYVLVILHERYIKWLYVLYPREWLMPSKAWMFGDAGVIILLIELTAILIMCFAFTAKRRLERI